MANEPTIEQKNEAIALFMGGSSIKEHGDKRYVYYPKSCAKDVAELRYHTSWDWLMRVVEKIHRLKEWRKDGKELRMFSTISVDMEFDGHYKQSRCSIIGTITYCHNETIPHKYTEIPVPHIWINKKKTAIEATHLAVYQFITWYNQQKQNNAEG